MSKITANPSIAIDFEIFISAFMGLISQFCNFLF